MNNNRGNNRRRGRGNNRQQGGQQINRIDSRARGNAPQLLEKYKKLAHDAHLNGDRVTEEYYLQFADHYFRVLADQRQRQDEPRQPRRDDRSQDYGDDYGTDDDIYGETAPSNGNGSNGNGPNGNGGNDRGGNDRGENDRGESERAGNDRYASDRGGHDRGQRFNRNVPEPAPVEEPAAAAGNDTPASDGEETAEGERSVYEPAENPFVRGGRGLKQRKPRRRSPEDADDAAGNAGPGQAAAPEGGFDPAALPPSISTKPAEKPADAPTDEAAEEKPKRRRTRKAAPPSDETDGKLEAVNG